MFDLDKYHNIQQIISNLGKKTTIVAISKNHSVEAVQEAISKGVEIFGENRVQEARLKFENILKKKKKIKLHLTGPDLKYKKLDQHQPIQVLPLLLQLQLL